MIRLEISEKPDSLWNERIKDSKFGTFVHTTYQSKQISKHKGYSPIFLFFKLNGNIVGQHLIYIVKRGSTPLKKFIGKFLKPYYFWHQSILVFDKNSTSEIIKLFLNFVNGKNFIGYDNPLTDYPLDLPHTKIGTVIIKLKDTFEETISKRDPSSTQKHIALAAHERRPTKKNVRSRMIKTENEIKIYYDMLQAHRTRLNLKTQNFEAFHDRITELNQHNVGGVLLAFHNDIPVSGIMYTCFNGWIYNLGVANTQYSLKNKLSSLDYLRCTLISLGIEYNCKYFELSGISLNPKNDKELGIKHSQTKWGGKIIEFNRYSNI